jgi:hypothetical protein
MQAFETNCHPQDYINEISVEELGMMEHLREDTIEILKSHRLNNLEVILEYHSLNDGFSTISGCNWEIMFDLKYLNRRVSKPGYKEKTETTFRNWKRGESKILNQLNDIDLATLAKIEKMHVRAFNVCNDAGLRSLKKIMAQYYFKGDTAFMLFRNSGKKTNQELLDICLKYEKKIDSRKDEKFS